MDFSDLILGKTIFLQFLQFSCQPSNIEKGVSGRDEKPIDSTLGLTWCARIHYKSVSRCWSVDDVVEDSHGAFFCGVAR